jgi:RimJ/RimL family protein N-acetyltransferase
MNNIFIPGESIDLCVPHDEDFEKWASWFNDQKITQFLEQGKYPNTSALQRGFYENAVSSGRFINLIKTKDGELLGVISLSGINYEKSSCQIALVCPVTSKKAIHAPLEAMALCTQHAIVRLGLENVQAGQAYPGLVRWIQKLELLGYKTDGVLPNEFRHGLIVTDAVRTSIGRDRFLSIVQRRGGNLWPGEEKIKKMIVKVKKEISLAEQVATSIKQLHAKHELLIESIEREIE